MNFRGAPTSCRLLFCLLVLGNLKSQFVISNVFVIPNRQCLPVRNLLLKTKRAPTMAKSAIVVANKVDSKIFVLRGQRVILDTDLAELYGVQVRQLNQQVKRNAKRFPPAFRFQLSPHELKLLRSQNVISSATHGGARYLPYAFTEHGAIMAATVLNSERAIEMSVFVVLAFVRMRRAIAGNRHILTKLGGTRTPPRNPRLRDPGPDGRPPRTHEPR